MPPSDEFDAFAEQAAQLERRIAASDARGEIVPPEARAMLAALRELAHAVDGLRVSLADGAGAAAGARPEPALPPRLRTERLVVRRWHPADAPLLKAAIDASLAHLQAWMPWAMAEPSPVEAIAGRLEAFARAFDAGDEWTYAILDPAEREVLGGAGVHRRGPPDELELGYWLRADAEGRGYATEAVRALADAAAGAAGVARLAIRCDPRNARSAALAARLGFRHVATLAADARTPDGASRDTMVWERVAGAGPA